MTDEQAERVVKALEDFVRLRSGDVLTFFGVPKETTHESTRAELKAALMEQPLITLTTKAPTP